MIILILLMSTLKLRLDNLPKVTQEVVCPGFKLRESNLALEPAFLIFMLCLPLIIIIYCLFFYSCHIACSGKSTMER